jgi:amidohydrolase
MAAVDIFKLTVEGVGGHAAMPHLSVDPILIGSHVVSALHTIVSRKVDPYHSAVMSICSVHGGTANNIIPEKVEYEGTVRTFLNEDRKSIPRDMKKMAEGIAKGMGGNAVLDYTRLLPSTTNDPKMAAFAKDVISTLFPKKNILSPDPSMGGEDFAYFLEKVPGAFIFLGAGNKEKGAIWPHHHPKFRLDEDAFVMGVEVLVRLVEKYLAK